MVVEILAEKCWENAIEIRPVSQRRAATVTASGDLELSTTTEAQHKLAQSELGNFPESMDFHRGEPEHDGKRSIDQGLLSRIKATSSTLRAMCSDITTPRNKREMTATE